jgi:hypothetical protein
MISHPTTDEQTAQLVGELELGQAAGPLHAVTFQDWRLVLAAGRYLVRMFPESGMVIDRFETFPSSGGIAFDGRALWQLSEGRLQQLEVRTGFVTRSAPLELDGVTGLELIEGDLLVLHGGGKQLSRVRVVEHAIDDRVALVSRTPSETVLRGLAWSGGELWSSTPGAIVRIDPATARILERVGTPGALELQDLAADDEGRFWAVDGASRRVRILSRPGWSKRRAPGMQPQAPPSSRVTEVTSSNGATTPGQAEQPATSMFARVLVCVDFSEASRHALAAGLALRDGMGSEVHLFHLADEGANDEFLAGIGASVGSGDLADEARARLRRFVDNVFPGRAGDVFVHSLVGDDVLQGLESAARQFGATLVVLTGKPRQSVFRAHAERVARDLGAAVLVLAGAN